MIDVKGDKFNGQMKVNEVACIGAALQQRQRQIRVWL